MPIQHLHDSTIFYRELGTGTPMVFLHGNPTSSHLWRNVLPAVGDPGRRLAPDLIGMGASGKPEIDYTFADHARYLAYPTRQSRLPLLRWPRSMPLDGEPADVVARIEAYDEWLATRANVPKLLLTFTLGPRSMMGPELIDWCAANIAALEIERHDAVAGHHTPEDHPLMIAKAVAEWANRHRLR